MLCKIVPVRPSMHKQNATIALLTVIQWPQACLSLQPANSVIHVVALPGHTYRAEFSVLSPVDLSSLALLCAPCDAQMPSMLGPRSFVPRFRRRQSLWSHLLNQWSGWPTWEQHGCAYEDLSSINQVHGLVVRLTRPPCSQLLWVAWLERNFCHRLQYPGSESSPLALRLSTPCSLLTLACTV